MIEQIRRNICDKILVKYYFRKKNFFIPSYATCVSIQRTFNFCLHKTLHWKEIWGPSAINASLYTRIFVSYIFYIYKSSFIPLKNSYRIVSQFGYISSMTICNKDQKSDSYNKWILIIFMISEKRYFVVFRHKFQDDIIQRQRWYYIISVLSQIYISKNVSNKTNENILHNTK